MRRLGARHRDRGSTLAYAERRDEHVADRVDVVISRGPHDHGA
jgi:hypothetical protein